jgi:hypothetical protein
MLNGFKCEIYVWGSAFAHVARLCKWDVWPGL